MVCPHVLNRGGHGVKSPVGSLLEVFIGMLIFNRNNGINLMDREDKMVLTEVVLSRFEKEEPT